MKSEFDGIYSAIFSIYDKERNVISDSVEKLVNYQLSNGLKGFYVGGNTGECTVLPNKTRKQMLEAVVKYNAGRGKIICHVGAGHIDDVYDLIEHANKLKIDAIASLPPSLTAFYNMGEIIDYYKTIAKLSVHPVFAYITPVVKGDLLYFAKELAKIDNIIGIKFSVPDYFTFGLIAESVGDKLILFNGPDECMICGLSIGANGAIGTTYNFMPKHAVDIYNKFNKGDIPGARQSQREMNKIIKYIIDYKPSAWKGAMSLRNIEVGEYIEPRSVLTADEMKKLNKDLTDLGFYVNE